MRPRSWSAGGRGPGADRGRGERLPGPGIRASRRTSATRGCPWRRRSPGPPCGWRASGAPGPPPSSRCRSSTPKSASRCPSHAPLPPGRCAAYRSSGQVDSAVRAARLASRPKMPEHPRAREPPRASSACGAENPRRANGHPTPHGGFRSLRPRTTGEREAGQRPRPFSAPGKAGPAGHPDRLAAGPCQHPGQPDARHPPGCRLSAPHLIFSP